MQNSFAAFRDVSGTDPDIAAYDFVQAQGIMTGSEDGNFHPGVSLSRCELMKVALLASRATLTTEASVTFSDIPATHWCNQYARTARAQGIVSGYPDGTFRPNQKVSQIEALKILFNSMHLSLPAVTSKQYEDVNVNDWWAPYIHYAQGHEITFHRFGSKYGIQNEMSRAEAAHIVWRISTLHPQPPITPASALSLVEEFATCPTATQKAAIDRDFIITFSDVIDNDIWENYPYVCNVHTFTSTEPTRVKVYNVIRFLKELEFNRPLPFTQDKSIYEYITTNSANRKLSVAVQFGCSLHSSAYNFTTAFSGNFSRWYPVLSDNKSECTQANPGAPDNEFVFNPLFAADLFVHEAQHAITNRIHTGGNGNDRTIDEMGAWAAQFYFNAWIALYSTNIDADTKQLAHDNAEMILDTRFSESKCPQDLSLKEIVNIIVPNSCS